MFDLDQLEEFDARLAELEAGKPVVGERSDALMDVSVKIISQADGVLADRHARPAKCPFAGAHGASA